MTRSFRPAVVAALLVATLAGTALAQVPSSGSPTLDTIKSRGQLACGVSGDVPGFSLPDSQGVMRGLDADSCRAVAAAVLGDANKVKFVPTDDAEPLHRAAIGRGGRAVAQHHLDAGPRGAISASSSPG